MIAMNRCALCGRKINNREFNFGLGCLKKACTFLQIKNVKNLKGEYLLNNKIQRLCKRLLCYFTIKFLPFQWIWYELSLASA